MREFVKNIASRNITTCYSLYRSNQYTTDHGDITAAWQTHVIHSTMASSREMYSLIDKGKALTQLSQTATSIRPHPLLHVPSPFVCGS